MKITIGLGPSNGSKPAPKQTFPKNRLKMMARSDRMIPHENAVCSRRPANGFGRRALRATIRRSSSFVAAVESVPVIVLLGVRGFRRNVAADVYPEQSGTTNLGPGE